MLTPPETWCTKLHRAMGFFTMPRKSQNAKRKS
jgi:hypothetical protein